MYPQSHSYWNSCSSSFCPIDFWPWWRVRRCWFSSLTSGLLTRLSSGPNYVTDSVCFFRGRVEQRKGETAREGGEAAFWHRDRWGGGFNRHSNICANQTYETVPCLFSARDAHGIGKAVSFALLETRRPQWSTCTIRTQPRGHCKDWALFFHAIQTKP